MYEPGAVVSAGCSECGRGECVGAEGVVGVGFGGVDGVVGRGVEDRSDVWMAAKKLSDCGGLGDVELLTGDSERGDVLRTKLCKQFVAELSILADNQYFRHVLARLYRILAVLSRRERVRCAPRTPTFL